MFYWQPQSSPAHKTFLGHFVQLFRIMFSFLTNHTAVLLEEDRDVECLNFQVQRCHPSLNDIAQTDQTKRVNASDFDSTASNIFGISTPLILHHLSGAVKSLPMNMCNCMKVKLRDSTTCAHFPFCFLFFLAKSKVLYVLMNLKYQY